MQIPEASGDWTGVILALGIALALIAGFFLVQRILRAWIRWRTGFSMQTRQARPIPKKDQPLEDHALQEQASDAVR